MLSLVLGIEIPDARAESAADQSNADAILAAALDDVLVDSAVFINLQIVAAGPEIIVRSDIPGSPLKIRPSALPRVDGKQLILLSTKEIRARADRRGEVYFVMVEQLELHEDTATFWIGVELTLAQNQPTLCCCSEQVTYSRVNGEWVYRTSSAFACS